MTGDTGAIINDVRGRYAGDATAPRTGTRTASWPWQRVALAMIVIMAAVLNSWRLDQIGYGNAYYAAAVKSMLQSWHNFFYVSFDPGGFVTIDKPPLGFWIEAASASLFGFSGVSLLIPEVLAAALSVAVLYRLVARAWGRETGLAAALVLALTPVSVVTARNNTIDSMLVLAVLLAAWAVSRAAESARLRWLALGAVLVGLGFNIKMLEAYLVVPAFGLTYLVGSRVSLPRRIVHLVLAVAVLLAVSLSWAIAVDRTVASQRPYVGSSGTNSELNLALGYNGLQRLTGTLFSHGNGTRAAGATMATASTGKATTQPGGAPGGGPGGAAGGNALFNGGPAGPFRLVGATLGGQVSWFLVLAALGLVFVSTRVSWRRPDARTRSVALWGTWMVTAGAFFSVAEFFHPYYLVMLAPAIAALAAIGLTSMWRAYNGQGWRVWLLPAALVATAAVQAYILQSYPDWSRWLTPAVCGVCVLTALVLVAARLRRSRVARSISLAAGAAVASLFAAPTAWAAYTVTHAVNATIPTAGPAAMGSDRGPGAGGGFGGPAGAPGPQTGPAGGQSGVGPGVSSGPRARVAAPGTGGMHGGVMPANGPAGRGASLDQSQIRYLEAHQGKATYLVATTSAMNAAPIIIATGRPVMAWGGFSGNDHILTTIRLATLVANGTVRYVLLDSGGPGGPMGAPVGPQSMQVTTAAQTSGRRGAPVVSAEGVADGNGTLTRWVMATCATVPSTAYAGASSTGKGTVSTDERAGTAGGGQQLYDCANKSIAVRGADATTARSGVSSLAAVVRGTRPNAPAHVTPRTGVTSTPGRVHTATALSRRSASASGPSAVGRYILTGQWVSSAASTVTLQTMQGRQAVSTTAATRYYQIIRTTPRALAAGKMVTLVPRAGSSSIAGSVMVAPAGGPVTAAISLAYPAYGVAQPGGRGTLPPVGPGTGPPPPGGGTGVPPGGNATTAHLGTAMVPGLTGVRGRAGHAGGAPTKAITGTIVAMTARALTLRTPSGLIQRFTLRGALMVYEAHSATPRQIASGSFVTIAAVPKGVLRVATEIVASSINGVVPSLVVAAQSTATP